MRFSLRCVLQIVTCLRCAVTGSCWRRTWCRNIF